MLAALTGMGTVYLVRKKVREDEEELQAWLENQITPSTVEVSDDQVGNKTELSEEEVRDRMEELQRYIRDINWHLPAAITEMVSNVQFTGRTILVGNKVVGTRIAGVDLEEVPWVAQGSDVRPIRDASEMHRRILMEHTYPAHIRRARVASGEALVEIHVQETPRYEEVIEPVYKTEQRSLYVLLDVSPSMWNDEGSWRIPLWQGIMIKLVERARNADVPTTIREFAGGVGKAIHITSWLEAFNYFRTLFADKHARGTNIEGAIAKAIADFQRMGGYDRGDIVIVTDGEDNAGMNPNRVRQALDENNLRLHALMLGIENDTLRQCSDIYQVIDPDLTIHPARRK